MPLELYTGPSGTGKTAFCVRLARQAAGGLLRTPCVVVPGALQRTYWQRGLAMGNGTLGVRVSTFAGLYRDILRRRGAACPVIGDAVQYRLLRVVVDGCSLPALAALRQRPGFVTALQRLFGELRSCTSDARAFSAAVDKTGGNARLRDLATIYEAYLRYLAENRWEDEEGLGWQAVAALRGGAPAPGATERLVIVDGFETFTPLQAALLTALAASNCRVVVALTVPPSQALGLLGGLPERRVREVEALLGVPARPLSSAACAEAAEMPAACAGGTLQALRAALFAAAPVPVAGAESALTQIEATDRAAEVRAALRWLKAELVRQPAHPEELALQARNLDAYRDIIVQVAQEYGVPVVITGGLPLGANPAVAALLNLLRLMVPLAANEGGPNLERRLLLEIWRSPYLNWDGHTSPADSTPIGITAAHARRLDEAARAGRVIEGLGQWREALARWVARAGRPSSAEEDPSLAAQTEGSAPVDDGPSPVAVQSAFERFLVRLTPPPQAMTLRAFVRWTEEIIGPDPLTSQGDAEPPPDDSDSLGMVRRIRGSGMSSERIDADIAALQSLKEVLRGLVWAEDALGADRAVGYADYVQEVLGAVAATRFEQPVRGSRGAVQVSEAAATAGVGYRAVALLGMAEGEFPSPLRDDPFITSAERGVLRRADARLLLPDPLESHEIERFYRAVASSWARVCLVRPRIADTGAAWAASPFWEEVARHVTVPVVQSTSERVRSLDEACSWPEVLDALRTPSDAARLADWLATCGEEYAGGRDLLGAMEICREVLRARRRRGAGPYDGDLTSVRPLLAARYGQGYVWGTSRLETYRSCALSFFMSSTLHLEPRAEPAEGLDAAQRGNVYHRILEQVYTAGMRAIGGATAPTLLALLPEVARRVLDEAPEAEGFRETAWWAHTRLQMEDDVRRSIVRMAEEAGEYVPIATEVRFDGARALVVRSGGTVFRVQGVIDRVDAAGGRVRIVDYKTAGPSDFTVDAVQQGVKLQLPLYAAAARDALSYGEPAEGYYWHIGRAQASPVRLSTFPGGPGAAIEVASAAAEEAVRGVLAGQFGPQPPPRGCPRYCAAAGFCWHYRAAFGG